ncbi:MAG: SPASM domain-containing protein [Halanaerobiales bacterium]|nr:SPASM domain-containing protein [Halanaerobiales bacterium]
MCEIFNNSGLKIQMYPCLACYGQLFYDGYGNIYPCAESIGNDSFIIGNYDSDINFNRNYKLLQKRNILELNGVCKECSHLLFCGAGCPYKAFLDTGDLGSADCGSYKEIINYLKSITRKELLYHQVKK